MEIKWSKKQKKMLQMPYDHTLDVLEGTPRSGKSTVAVARFAMFVYNSPKDAENFLVLAYSQEQAFRLVIDCDGMGLMHIFPEPYSQVKHGDFGDYLEIKTPRGKKKVYYKGAGKADSQNAYQGLSIEAVFFCELPLLNRKAVKEAFRRTFAAKNRWHIADLNPCAPNHPIIDEVFNQYKMNWTHWTIDDNPIITEERKRELFEELSKSDYLFRRDWLGERVVPQGVIYSMFDNEKHILDSLPKYIRPVEMYFAGDGGNTHATSIGCFIVGETPQNEYNLYKVGEYYYDKEHLAMSLQAEVICNQFIPYFRKLYNMYETNVFIDPACKSLREEMNLKGISTRGADNNAKDAKGEGMGVVAGIERLQNSITKGKFFLVRCPNDEYNHYGWLKEISLYSINEKTGLPIKLYDDSCDETRYGHNYFYKSYVK